MQLKLYDSNKQSRCSIIKYTINYYYYYYNMYLRNYFHNIFTSSLKFNLQYSYMSITSNPSILLPSSVKAD